jgi:tRNA threonylcarbamoyladenosine biosynthesis protein TsaB
VAKVAENAPDAMPEASFEGVQFLNILALDTSTARGALAVSVSGGTVLSATTDPALRHGRNLIPAIRDLIHEAGLVLGDLHLVAVGLGPGSYTGLRIGLTAAKTLAFALKKPLIGLDSLEPVARNAPADALRVAVIADAQRGDLYTAAFERAEPGGALLRTTATRIEPRDAWLERLSPGTLVLGPALDRLRPPLPDSVRVADPGLGLPDGRRLIDLAREGWNQGQRDDIWFLEPNYLRRSAAEEQWARLGR